MAGLALLACPAAACARSGGEQLIVRFEAGTSAAARTDARSEASVSFTRTLPLPGMQVVEVDSGRSASEAEARLDRDPRVRYAEPNLTRTAVVLPNDTYFSQEWGLHNTGQAVLGVTGKIDADIDARHDYDSVKEDLEAWFDKLRPGGIFAGHDYVDGTFSLGVFGVKAAVDEFFGARGLMVKQTYLEGARPSVQTFVERARGGRLPSWLVELPRA